MASLFSKIVSGEIPCHKVYEDDDHLAFLDIAPIRPGHTLVIPKTEIDQVFDMEPDAHAALWTVARRVAEAVREVTGAPRVASVVLGFEVPHAHVHLIPVHDESDFVFPPRLPTDHEALAAMAARIGAEL